jgi:deoxyribodipyrimidine photo-lyase
MSKSLHIFYQNLRLKDNPSLLAATKHDQMLALYVLQDHGRWAMGAASKVWLNASLSLLSHDLKEHGIKLHFAKGDLASKVLHYVKQCQITDVYFDVPIEPGVIAFEDLKKGLEKLDVNLHLFYRSLLFDPETLRTKTGQPYQVFTPFYKACLASKIPEEPLGAPRVYPKNIHADSLELDDLKLLPKIKWYTQFDDYFEPGEKGAMKAFSEFRKEKVKHYKVDRDFPSMQGTSRLSPHLHFGEISPHQIYHELNDTSHEPYKRQLIWREFAHHLLFHFPKTPEDPLKEQYKDFPWHKNASLLNKWQKGQTGIPIVDAGMRELWHTGWMHNRVRMIVGSFLVKDLLIPWQEGAKWFWDTLVDADLANNTLGWQWVAGCGADAAPYFRIFNPYIQSAKFDPNGDYIKKFVPELKDLDAKYIHAPHEVDETILRQAGVILGKTYPRPIIDHKEAKEKALKIYYDWNT